MIRSPFFFAFIGNATASLLPFPRDHILASPHLPAAHLYEKMPSLVTCQSTDDPVGISLLPQDGFRAPVKNFHTLVNHIAPVASSYFSQALPHSFPVGWRELLDRLRSQVLR